MKRSLCITTALSIGAIAALLLAANNRSAALQRQIDHYDENVEAIGAESLGKADKTTPTPTPPDLVSILALIPESPAEGDFAGPMALLPVAARHVRSCDPDALLNLARELLDDNGLTKDRRRSAAIIARLYIFLAAEDSPAKTLEFYERHLSDKLTGSEVARGLLVALARVDPNAALLRYEKLDGKPETPSRTRASMIGTLLAVDPELGFELLMAAGSKTAKLAASIAGLEPASSNALRERLPTVSDPSLRGDLSIGLVSAVLLSEGVEAARVFLKNMGENDPGVRQKIATEFVRGVAASTPEMAIAIAQQELDGHARIIAIADAAGKWAQKDFNAAARWLGDQEASPVRAAAISAFAREVKSINPDAARTWANEISIPELRRRTLEQLSANTAE